MGNAGTIMSKSVEDHKTKGASPLCVDTGTSRAHGAGRLARVDSTDSPKIAGTLNISHWMQQELAHGAQRGDSSPGLDGRHDRPPTRNASDLDLSSLVAEPKPAVINPASDPSSVSPNTLVRHLAVLEESTEQSEGADVESVVPPSTEAERQRPPTPVKSIFASVVAKSRENQ